MESRLQNHICCGSWANAKNTNVYNNKNKNDSNKKNKNNSNNNNNGTVAASNWTLWVPFCIAQASQRCQGTKALEAFGGGGLEAWVGPGLEVHVAVWYIWGLPKIRGPYLGAPIIRTI